MIKNIFTHWRTTAPGVLAIVTGIVSLTAFIAKHTIDVPTAIALIMGILGGIGLLYSQDYTQGAQAHAESQNQISELQKKVDLIPQAISSGDTSTFQKAPITPVATSVDNPPKTS